MGGSNRLHLALMGACAAGLTACGGGSGGGGSTTYAISGTVTGATAVAVALSGASAAVTTTDAGGAYSFSGLANGAYAVTPSKAGFAFAPPSRSVTVSGASVAGQDFAATATHSVSGTVTGATAVAVALSGAATAAATTDGNGGYAFAGLADGAYTVTPSKAGFTFAPPSRSVAVSGADVGGQDFVASPVVGGTRTVSGTVAGTVVDGVTVTLGGAGSGSTTTGPAGHYAFAGLPDGSYTVTPSLLDAAATFHAFSPPLRQVTVAGADVGGQDFAGAPLADFESFAGTVSATRWDGGEHLAVLEAGAAQLASAVDAPVASTTYGASLVVAPGAVTGRTTWVGAVVRLASTSWTGDAVARAGIDLVFQPPEKRVASPDNLANALFVRVALQDSSAGLVAVRQVFACTAPDCTSTQAVGTVVAGGAAWPGTGLGSIALDTPYAVSISFDTAASRFTFSIQGGSHVAAVTATVDLSAVVTPPFPIDLSQGNFHRTRLFTQVRGGSLGGAGDGGAIFASFDDVAIGVDGQAAAAFDDFGAGTMFEPARWSVGGAAAAVVSGALEVRLQQRSSPAVSSLALRRDLVPATTALQARVTVQSLTRAGTGQVGARLAATLYNDGSNGLVPPPTPADVSQPSSQVGDVIAQVSVSDMEVSYAVVRCNVAVCTGPGATGGGVTFVVPRTALRTTSPGLAHNLLLRWDPASHLVVFQVDNLPPAVVDPTAGPDGLPVASGPHREFWQLANHAGAAGPGVDFSTGSSGDIQSIFQFVKRL
ncbi:MAG TPA: carboxypeptidase-like regulatory domain-containing protein [Anaeromyxobacteraceae bacterium]|jgi:hypothetical protein